MRVRRAADALVPVGAQLGDRGCAGRWAGSALGARGRFGVARGDACAGTDRYARAGRRRRLCTPGARDVRLADRQRQLPDAGEPVRRSTSSATRTTPRRLRSAARWRTPRDGWRRPSRCPEDIGGAHPIAAIVGQQPVAQAAFQVVFSATMTPLSGPVGTPIEITVHGQGPDPWSTTAVRYDNHFTGFVSAVTTHGTARAQIHGGGRAGPALHPTQQRLQRDAVSERAGGPGLPAPPSLLGPVLDVYRDGEHRAAAQPAGVAGGGPGGPARAGCPARDDRRPDRQPAPGRLAGAHAGLRADAVPRRPQRQRSAAPQSGPDRVGHDGPRQSHDGDVAGHDELLCSPPPPSRTGRSAASSPCPRTWADGT